MKINTLPVIKCAYAERIGTVNCIVKLRLTPEDERIIREYYDMSPNHPMFSRGQMRPAPEVFSLGNGWYVIYGDGERKDSAMHCLNSIQVALVRKVRPKQRPNVQRAEVIKHVYEKKRKVFVVVHPKVTTLASGKKVTQPVAITRALQALNHEKESWYEHRPIKPTLEDKVEALRRRFSR
jgi:hypothetical protein